MQDGWGEDKQEYTPASFSRPGEEPPKEEPRSETPPPPPQQDVPVMSSTPPGGRGAAGSTWREPEAAIEHGFDVDIGGNLSRAFSMFGKSIGVFILLGVLMVVFYGIIFGLSMAGWFGSLLGTLISVVVGPLVTAGVIIVIARAVMGNAPSINDFMKGTKYIMPVFLLNLVMGILTTIGFYLLVVPGIYLSVSWCLAAMLVIDRDLDFWTAMETSRRIVSRNWWSVFGALLVFGLVAMAGLIVFGIGYLVTAPVAMIAVIMLYEKIVGFKKADF